jgi:hypothetical protein
MKFKNGNADGADPCTASVMRRISPFYSVMFVVLMRLTYIPELSLWLPRLRFHLVASPPPVSHLTSHDLR